MALIKCSECGKEISDTIKNCIHCGYNFKLINFLTISNKEKLILETKSGSGEFVQNVIRNQILVPKEISILKFQVSINYELLKTLNEVELKELLYKHFRG